MKKIFLVAAMAAVVLTCVNAQNKYKPENMSFSTELNYSPGGATTDGQFSLPDYGAKVRLHLNEKMAVRLKLGLNSSLSVDVFNGCSLELRKPDRPKRVRKKQQRIYHYIFDYARF